MNNRRVLTEPISRSKFAPYGEVIDTHGDEPFEINEGNCLRFHDLAKVEAVGSGGRVLINLFRANAYSFPLALGMVERHPLGSQAFIPLNGQPFLVVVASDKEGRPGRPLAFMTRPGQGVNYRRNVWHAVLTPIARTQDFVVVDRGGDGENLELFHYDDPWIIELP